MATSCELLEEGEAVTVAADVESTVVLEVEVEVVFVTLASAARPRMIDPEFIWKGEASSAQVIAEPL